MMPEEAKDQDQTQPEPADAASWALVGLSAACLLASVIFLSLPGIDLTVAGWFYDETAGLFPLARHPIPLFFNDFIELVALVLGVGSIIGVIYTSVRKRTWLGLTARAYSFLMLSLITGPGLIANALFKENWGRARPRQIIEFGGEANFTPAMVMADQCPGNCSFVSGDASMGFAVLALALIMPPLWGLSRQIWVALALAFGAFIGGVRIVQGAHFFSDVIFAGLFVSMAILSLKAIILDGRWGLSAWTEKGLSRFANALAGPMGLAHGEEMQAWRTNRFAALDTGGWKRALWLFFASGPKDFDLPEPESSIEKGRSEDRPSQNILGHQDPS